jgi:hypothetical protein
MVGGHLDQHPLWAERVQCDGSLLHVFQAADGPPICMIARDSMCRWTSAFVSTMTKASGAAGVQGLSPCHAELCRLASILEQPQCNLQAVQQTAGHAQRTRSAATSEVLMSFKPPCTVGAPSSAEASGTLGVTMVAAGSRCCRIASMTPPAASASPLVATSTGSTTRKGRAPAPLLPAAASSRSASASTICVSRRQPCAVPPARGMPQAVLCLVQRCRQTACRLLLCSHASGRQAMHDASCATRPTQGLLGKDCWASLLKHSPYL